MLGQDYMDEVRLRQDILNSFTGKYFTEYTRWNSVGEMIPEPPNGSLYHTEKILLKWILLQEQTYNQRQYLFVFIQLIYPIGCRSTPGTQQGRILDSNGAGVSGLRPVVRIYDAKPQAHFFGKSPSLQP